METLIGPNFKSAHYHDASEHGIIWSLLNQLLHFIVLIYTLYGMIQFKVKFIHMVRLIELLRWLIVAHSWYLTIKFALVAAVLYLFSDELAKNSLELADYNCSLENHAKVFARVRRLSAGAANKSHVEPDAASWLLPAAGHVWRQLTQAREFMLHLDYPLLYSHFLHHFGGPFKMLGNLSTLMYGFFSIAIYIMLAIFPLELTYLKIGFNHIRFVLNDTSCMNDLYINRRRHLERLGSWSRNETSSELTMATKMALNQRHLRTRFAAAVSSRHRHAAGGRLQLTAAGGQSHAGLVADKIVTTKLGTKVKSLRRRLAVNHMETPSYQVKIANKNLQMFKPFVRSESWFKLSMIIYPIFIFYYFSLLVSLLGLIAIYIERSLRDIERTCAQKLTGQTATSQQQAHWTPLDQLLYFETQYAIFALSCASSFYCSYYFGTILELLVWISEISQQLDLNKIIVEITDDTLLMSYLKQTTLRAHELRLARRPAPVDQPPTRRGRQQLSRSLESLLSGDKVEPAASRLLPQGRQESLIHCPFGSMFAGQCHNEFGGITSLSAYLSSVTFSSQSARLRLRECMAIRLLTKKQTLLRATYINLCLLIDELNETRLMTTTILRRTTQIVFGFAMMASITRSQFQANYWHLTALLASCLAILNLYLVCAALINGRFNKLLVQVHSLISASLRTSSEDADLFEFWLRHIRSFGEDKDIMSYKIYGYKVTWATVLNFDSAVCTAYFYTIY